MDVAAEALMASRLWSGSLRSPSRSDADPGRVLHPGRGAPQAHVGAFRLTR